MIGLKMIIAFIPTIIVILFGLLSNRKKISIDGITKLILYGLIMMNIMLVAFIMKYPLGLILISLNKVIPDLYSKTILVAFIDALFMAGIREEIIKRFIIKKTKPITPSNILYNCIFISSMFISLENTTYMSNYEELNSIYTIGIYRSFLPVHFVCQLILAFFLIKIEDRKKEGRNIKGLNFMSYLIPILIHTIYNTWVSFDQNIVIINNITINYIAVILGIITYIAILYYMFYIKNKYSEELNTNKDIKKRKLVGRILLIILLYYIWSIMFFIPSE